MSIVLNSSGGGSVSIVEPTTASNFTQTLPASTGTVMVSGNMPAFSAYNSTTQSISNATDTKITYDTELFDTNSNFASSRFTPTVAGYYQIIASVRDGTGGVSGQLISYIYLNGGNNKFCVLPLSGAVGTTTVCSALMYMNGSTDFLEHYVRQSSGVSMNISASPNTTFFSGVLVRAA